MSTLDRNTQMSTIDQTGANSSAASPFFIAAVAVTIALGVLAALVGLLS